MFKFIAVICLFMVGCTDAEYKQYSTIGNVGTITCWSGGVMIYTGKSSGKIASENGSDGWFFEDSQTHELIRVSGDCLIRN